jgi:single-strand DNA-binding protein
MSSFNSVTLLGNLGADPEMRYTPSGKAVANLRLAVNERYTDSAGDTRHSAHWFSVECWDKLAELGTQYLQKGSRVLVQGRLKTRSYDGSDGVTRYVTDVVATNLVFLDSPKDSRGSLDNVADSPELQEALPF